MNINKIKHHRDNNYLNVVINPDPNIVPGLSPCIYNETLTIAIIDNPSLYYASVIRFTLPLDTIPLLVFPVDAKQNDPLVSYLTVGIQTALGANFPVRVIYDSKNAGSPPTPALSSPYFNDSQLSDPYYFIYSIVQMINMFNTALDQAVTNSAIGVSSPFYSYNPVTQLISLNVTAAFIATNAKIFVNNYMINYLNSFSWFASSSPTFNSPIGFDYYHVLDPLPPNSPIGGPYVYSEDFISMALWFDLRKIIVTSNSLPINPEQVPSQNSSGVSASIPIVTDFSISFDTTGQAQTVAIYNPSAQYRLIDMSSSTPLFKVNFAFLWEDKFGTVYPVYLSPAQQASLKIGFFKKELYNNYL